MPAPPAFPPLPRDPLAASFPGSPERQQAERRRTSWSSLKLLADQDFNSYVPYAWGFTIYRIRFAGDSDERFQAALERLTKWVKWIVRSSRFTEEGLQYLNRIDMPSVPLPTADEPDPTDTLADRLFNEVIDFVPADEDSVVITEPEGSEDFSEAGRAFSERLATLGVDLDRSKNNARYDHCLFIDENALRSLELLPEVPPPLEYRQRGHEKHTATHRSYCNSWVWVLDRKLNDEGLVGEVGDHIPWMRLKVHDFMELWFERPKGTIPLDWGRLRMEDTRKWETVGWWCSQAVIVNTGTRLVRQQFAEQEKRE